LWNYERDQEIAETLEIQPLQVRALRTDKDAVRVARGQGLIDLALGETMSALFQGDKLLQLGYSREADYMRERMGIRQSQCTSFHSWSWLAARFRG
jgi:hypothetical protein